MANPFLSISFRSSKKLSKSEIIPAVKHVSSKKKKKEKFSFLTDPFCCDFFFWPIWTIEKDDKVQKLHNETITVIIHRMIFPEWSLDQKVA